MREKKSSLFHAIYLIAKWIWLRSIVGSAFKNSPLLSNVIYFISSSCSLHASASEKWFDLLVFSLPFSTSVRFRPPKYHKRSCIKKYRNHLNVIKLSWKIIAACQLSHLHTCSVQTAVASTSFAELQRRKKNDWIFRLIPVTWLRCWNAMWHWLLQLDFIGIRDKDYYSPWVTSYFCIWLIIPSRFGTSMIQVFGFSEGKIRKILLLKCDIPEIFILIWFLIASIQPNSEFIITYYYYIVSGGCKASNKNKRITSWIQCTQVYMFIQFPSENVFLLNLNINFQQT